MTSASVQPPVPCLAASVCTARLASLSVTMSRSTVVAPRRIHCGRGRVALRTVKSEKSVQLLCALFLFIKKSLQQELSLGRGAQVIRERPSHSRRCLLRGGVGGGGGFWHAPQGLGCGLSDDGTTGSSLRLGPLCVVNGLCGPHHLSRIASSTI